MRSVSSFKSPMDLLALNNGLPIRMNASIGGVLANPTLRELFRKGHR